MISFPIFLSQPALQLPEQKLDNEEVLRRIRQNYQGDEATWQTIEAGVRIVFQKCNSQFRYIEEAENEYMGIVGDYAAKAAKACLEENGVLAQNVDLLIYGGVARQYFEPATAMEVAAKIGIETVHAFDVTSACAGILEGIQIALAYFHLYPHYQTALVCSGELSGRFLSYNIQSVEEFFLKSAGLTIGNGGGALLLQRNPFAKGSLRILGMHNHCLPQNYHLCSASVNGCFSSNAAELFKLNKYVAPEIRRFLEAQIGWQPDEVDHYVFHQPSESIVKKVGDDLGVDQSKVLLTHHLYGNTASLTVPFALHELLKRKRIEAGAKMVLCTAAAGLSIVTLAGTWDEGTIV
jgi:3-oxoacyl-[acyl-carrier-protein] synthase-3